MLRELTIKNLAVVDELHVTFNRGFCVLTGETGAGKTILVQAIGLILGERPSPSLIRDGSDEGFVEACFDLSDLPLVRHSLEHFDFVNADCEHEVVIQRHISRSGSSRVYVNFKRAALRQVQHITGQLIDFAGQNEQLRLLETGQDIHLLDGFLPDKNAKKNYQKAWHEAKLLSDQIVQMGNQMGQREQKTGWLKFQLKEFDELKIASTEEEQNLRRQREQIKHQSLLREFEERVRENFLQGSANAVGLIKSVCKKIRSHPVLERGFADLMKRCEEAQLQLEDIAYEVNRRMKGGVNGDFADLDAIDHQLFVLEKLKRKFGPNLEDVFARKNEFLQELTLWQNVEEELRQMHEKFGKCLTDLRDKALALSQERKKLKARLERLIRQELKSLCMPKVLFEIHIRTKTADELENFANYTTAGVDDVVFLLSPNPGLSPKPLSRIASGGETSRIFLALKQVLSRQHPGGTFIFDEIDAGVSGDAVERLGIKLKDLARRFQVFCVTHHPQIACRADSHYKVEKQVSKNQTRTKVKYLGVDERMMELARLLGGSKISEKNLAYARELLSLASEN